MRRLIYIYIASLFASFAQAQGRIRTEQVRVPGSDIRFHMALLPGGPTQIGSPASEAGRSDDEGPQRAVRIDSFWIGTHEVTFDEFFLFQFREKDSDESAQGVFKADAIARPSPPYYDFTYGRGKAGGFPAATMTQQAALRYCQWLSDKTGDLYRLPTEAEWEYACRAGAKDAYSFGAEPGALGEYAWYFENSSGSYQKTGTKKPNAWGLYDMHGNIAEWTLDFYVADYLQKLSDSAVLSIKARPGKAAHSDGTPTNPWMAPAKKHSRTVKGGSFEDYAPECRCADRRKSEPKWQARDPQIPKSKWWNPDSWFVGFRIVRETKPYTKAERDAFFAAAIKD